MCGIVSITSNRWMPVTREQGLHHVVCSNKKLYTHCSVVIEDLRGSLQLSKWCVFYCAI